MCEHTNETIRALREPAGYNSPVVRGIGGSEGQVIHKRSFPATTALAILAPLEWIEMSRRRGPQDAVTDAVSAQQQLILTPVFPALPPKLARSACQPGLFLRCFTAASTRCVSFDARNVLGRARRTSQPCRTFHIRLRLTPKLLPLLIFSKDCTLLHNSHCERHGIHGVWPTSSTIRRCGRKTNCNLGGKTRQQ